MRYLVGPVTGSVQENVIMQDDAISGPSDGEIVMPARGEDDVTYDARGSILRA